MTRSKPMAKRAESISSLNYLESTLKSPRLRAILDKAKQRKDRPEVADPARVRVCDGTDPYAEAPRTPPTMFVLRGLQGPFLKVITGEGEFTLTPVDVDTLLRLARQNGMVTT